jgi:hypothetical protein
MLLPLCWAHPGQYEDVRLEALLDRCAHLTGTALPDPA